LYFNVNEILQKFFQYKSIDFISCKNKLEDIIREDQQIETITLYHEGKTNHRGITETIKRVKEKYFWPNLLVSVQNYINTCEICLQNKYERNLIQLNLRVTQTSTKPLETLHMDVVSLDKDKYLTIIDSFSKFVHIYRLNNMTSIDIANKLLKFLSQYTIPDKIVCDNGKEFNNIVIKEFLALHKINIHFTSIDNPNSNGQIERFHSTLIEHLRLLNLQKEYKNLILKDKIKYAMIGYNNTIHSATNYKPIDILFGHFKSGEINLDLENYLSHNYVQNNEEKMQIIYKELK